MQNRDRSPSDEPDKFISWLHRSYMQSSAVSQFIGRRITRVGFAMVGICVLTLAMAGGKAVGSMFQVLGITSATVFFAFIWATARGASATGVRDIPSHGAVGQPVRYRVKVTNTGKRKIADSWLLESAPDSRPSLELFDRSREPGEHKRNAFDKTFRFYRWMWLNELNEYFSDCTAEESFKIKPGECRSVNVEWVPNRRGIVKLNDLRLLLPDPFGLFQRCIPISSADAEVVIYPERFYLNDFRLPGGSHEEQGAQSASTKTGESQEFATLRDYRQGDPFRHIHWRTWARSGKAVIKEFEQTNDSRFALWLDSLPAKESQPDAFENAVKVAAGFAASDRHDGPALEFLASGDEIISTRLKGEFAAHEEILRTLAEIEITAQDPEASLNPFLNHRNEVSGCVAIFHAWDEQRQHIAKALARTGIELSLILIAVDSELLIQFPPPAKVTRLDAEHFASRRST